MSVTEPSSGPVPTPGRDCRRAVAIGCWFFALGLLTAQPGARLPSIKESLRLNDGALSLLLCADDVGQLSLLVVAGLLSAWFGAARVAATALFFLCLSLPVVGWAAVVGSSPSLNGWKPNKSLDGSPDGSPSLDDRTGWVCAGRGWQVLAVGLVLTGGSGAVLDVSMNAEAATLDQVREERGKTPMMSRFHAVFSMGFGAGGAVAGAAAGLGWSPVWNFVVVGAGMFLGQVVVWLTLFCTAGGQGRGGRSCDETGLATRSQPLLRDEPADHAQDARQRDALFDAAHAQPQTHTQHSVTATSITPTRTDPSSTSPTAWLASRQLWLIGLCAFLSSVGEGSVGDWASVYFHSVLGTSQSLAPLGFVAFNITMVIMRLLGDHVTVRYSKKRILLCGGLVAGAGLLLVAAVPAPIAVSSARPEEVSPPALAVLGFACVGLGLAVVIPVAFSAAGSVPNVDPAVGIGFVSTVGYAGMLLGPPLIGGTGYLCGTLRAGMAVDGLLMLMLAVLAPAIGE